MKLEEIVGLFREKLAGKYKSNVIERKATRQRVESQIEREIVGPALH